MDTTVQNVDLYNEGKELAYKARNQALEGKEVTVICPKCHKKPSVEIEGEFNERIMVRCDCGYIRHMQLGI